MFAQPREHCAGGANYTSQLRGGCKSSALKGVDRAIYRLVSVSTMSKKEMFKMLSSLNTPNVCVCSFLCL